MWSRKKSILGDEKGKIWSVSGPQFFYETEESSRFLMTHFLLIGRIETTHVGRMIALNFEKKKHKKKHKSTFLFPLSFFFLSIE